MTVEIQSMTTDVILDPTTNVILDTTTDVILGLDPRIHGFPGQAGE